MHASYTGTHVHDMYPIMNEKGGGVLLLVRQYRNQRLEARPVGQSVN